MVLIQAWVQHDLDSQAKAQARLHLEVLRVLLWCFNVVGFNLEIQPEAKVPYICV